MSVLTRDEDSRMYSPRRAVAGLLGTVALVGVAGTQISFERLWAALAGVDTRILAVVVGAAIAVLLLRGAALWVLLEVLGYRTPPGRALSVYAATVAVSTLVPGGQAGGAPINGYLVSESSGTDYEDGIAAVVGIAALSNAAMGIFGLFGVGYLLSTASGQDGVITLAMLGTALFGLGVLALAAIWRVRDRAAAVAAAAVASAGRVVGTVPGLSPPERDTIDRKLNRFVAALDRLRDGTLRQFVVLAVLMGLAHALTVVALWICFAAVGQPVSVGVILAVIPAGAATAVVPTPGGFGSIEVALVGLIAAGTSASVPIASAAVLVYQTGTTVPPLLVGGGILAVMLSLGLTDGGQQYEIERRW
ncbi:MAG: hypothetical protein ACI9TI_000909 [Natronomonas sp.]|jgi:uncharacterized protein (TIRG00374 family)